MSISRVTCGADVHIGVSSTLPSGYTMNLSASAVPGPIVRYAWTLLFTPSGGESARNSGDFVSGISVGQAVSFVAPAGISGTYVVQCIATNDYGESNPFIDGEGGQQCLIIADADGMEVPGDFQFNYGATLRSTIDFLKDNGGGGGGGTTFKVTANDTTEGYANAKIDVGTSQGLTKAVINPGANEVLRVTADFGTAAGKTAQGNDARFPTTDEKAALGGTSGVPSATNKFVTNADSRNADSRNPLSHAIGGSAHSVSTLAQLNAKVSDAVLDGNTASRTPLAHKSSHQSGGSDAIKIDDLSAPDDNTDLNATTGAHGLLPKLSGVTTQALLGDGTWGAVGGASPLTTKGDLYTFNTGDARLPVGTDGHVLTSDSNEATGLKWQAGGTVKHAQSQIIPIIDYIPTTTISLTTDSFVDIANGSDRFEAVFSPSFSGLYAFMIRLEAWLATTSATTVWFYRFVIDQGNYNGHTEQIIEGGIGDTNEGWCVSSKCASGESGFRGYTSIMSGGVDLVGGSEHKITMQWRLRTADVGDTVNMGPYDMGNIVAFSISGSGAGGVVPTDNVINDVVLTNASAVTLISEDVTVTDADDLLVIFHTRARPGTATTTWSVSGSLEVDGSPCLFNLDGVSTRNFFGTKDEAGGGTFDVVNLHGCAVIPRSALGDGTHTISVLASSPEGASNNVTLYAPWFQTAIFRGGTVEIRGHDGAVVQSMPRFVQYLNAQVYESADVPPGTIVDFAAGAAGPGDLQQLGEAPTSTYIEVSGTTPVQIVPESGSLAFEALAAGLYRVDFHLLAYFGFLTSAEQATFKIVVDEGEATEQTIGDTAAWEYRVDGALGTNGFIPLSFVDQVTLTTGSHTVKVYGRMSGSNCYVRAYRDYGTPRVTLHSVTGSTVGGLLVESYNAPTTEITDDYIADVSELSVIEATVVVAEGERVFCNGLGNIRLTEAGTFQPYFRLYVDDVKVVDKPNQWTSAAQWQYGNVDFGYFTDELSVGLHTFKVTVSKYQISNVNGFLYAGKLQIARYRGGMVPWYLGSELKTDKPVRHVVDPETMDLTAQGGIVTLSAKHDARGVETTVYDAITSPITMATTPGSLVVSHTIEGAVEGESILLSFSGDHRHGGTTGQDPQGNFNVFLNSVQIYSQVSKMVDLATWRTPVSMTHEIILPAGDSTIEIYAVGGGTGTSQLYSSYVTVSRYRGGYAHGENLPKFSRDSSDGSLVHIQAWPGARNLGRLLLNDGRMYQASYPTSVDLDTSTQVGGHDPSESVAIGLWHLYAIPDPTDNARCVFTLSQQPPLTSSPPNQSIFRYLWTLNNRAAPSASVSDFDHVGEWYFVAPSQLTAHLVYSGSVTSPTLSAWEPLNTSSGGSGGSTRAPIQNLVPVDFVNEVLFDAACDADDSDLANLLLEGGNPPAAIPTWAARVISLQSGSTGQQQMSMQFSRILRNNMVSVLWTACTGTIDFAIAVRAYRNPLYLGGPSKLTPVTSPTEPKLVTEWNGADTTQFGSAINGSNVSASSISVVTRHGLKWIEVSVTNTSGGAGATQSAYFPFLMSIPPDAIIEAEFLIDTVTADDNVQPFLFGRLANVSNGYVVRSIDRPANPTVMRIEVLPAVEAYTNLLSTTGPDDTANQGGAIGMRIEGQIVAYAGAITCDQPSRSIVDTTHASGKWGIGNSNLGQAAVGTSKVLFRKIRVWRP